MYKSVARHGKRTVFFAEIRALIPFSADSPDVKMPEKQTTAPTGYAEPLKSRRYDEAPSIQIGNAAKP
jgi:hypothetical protein